MLKLVLAMAVIDLAAQQADFALSLGRSVSRDLDERNY